MDKITNDNEMLNKIHDIVAASLFDFMGWLTSRTEVLTLSYVHDCVPAADAIKKFLEMRNIKSSDPDVLNWNESICIDTQIKNEDLPEGFYLLSSDDYKDISLVKLYTCDDFNGIKHIAFGPWDGGGIMPLSHLSENSKLTPITMVTSDKPINELEQLIK